MSAWSRFAMILVALQALAPVCPGQSQAMSSSPFQKPFNILFDKGRYAQLMGAFGEAADGYRQALSYARERGMLKECVASLIKLGIVAWDDGQVKTSLDFFTEASSLTKRLDEPTTLRVCSTAMEIIRHYNLGKDLRASNDCAGSIRNFDLAIQLSHRIRVPDFELKCLRQQALTYLQTDDLGSFMDRNVEGLRIAIRLNHDTEKGRCLNNLGLGLIRRADYTLALRCFAEAEASLRSQADVTSLAECLSNTGIAYRDLGDYVNAMAYLELAYALDKKAKDDGSTVRDLINIGALHLTRGIREGLASEYVDALADLNTCLSTWSHYLGPPEVMALLNNIGLAHHGLGDYDSALAFFFKALNASANPGSADDRGNILTNMGTTYLKKGELDRSEASFLKALSSAGGSPNGPVVWEAYYGLGRCQEERGNLTAAYARLSSAIEAIETTRARISADDPRLGFFRDKLEVYQRAIDTLIKRYSLTPTENLIDELFFMVEKAKARAFIEGLHEISVDEVRDSRVTEGTRVEAKESESLVASLTSLLSAGGKTVNPCLKTTAKDSRSADEEHVLRQNSPRPFPGPMKIDEAQRMISDGSTALLEYYLGEKESLLFVIRRATRAVYILPPRATVESSIRAFLKMLNSPGRGAFEGVRAAERLCQELLPISSEIGQGGIDNLIIIPDGRLHYLPFEALELRARGRLNFLVENARVSYCPSSSARQALLEGRRGRTSGKKLLAFGGARYDSMNDRSERAGGRVGSNYRLYIEDGFSFPSLPFSRREVLDIVRLFDRASVDYYLDADANEALLKSLALEKYRVLHFACHGVLNERIPARSALVLSLTGSPGDDGFLQAKEICSLRLNADLVVLSACQIGSGSLEASEGLIGLPRMFFFAGAKAVISPLWTIYDRATARFMRTLYGYLIKGLDKDRALQLTKMDMLRTPYAHPYYWAAFVLSGNPLPF